MKHKCKNITIIFPIMLIPFQCVLSKLEAHAISCDRVRILMSSRATSLFEYNNDGSATMHNHNDINF